MVARMAENRNADAGVPASDDSTLPSPGKKSPDASTASSADSLLRAAAQISEPSPSEVAAYVLGPPLANLLASVEL
jgi:hypothetical protein